jgi:hypothetical protein
MQFQLRAAGKEMPRGPALVVQAAPLNMSPQWREWSVSAAGVKTAKRMVETVSRSELDLDNPSPHPTGVAVAAKERQGTQWTPGGYRWFTRTGVAAIDGGGGIGLRLGFQIKEGGGRTYDWKKLTDDGELEALLAPLLGALSAALTESELLGRYAMDLQWVGMDDLFRLDPERAGEGTPPRYVPGSGLLTVDGLEDSSERKALTRRWSEELLRASGVPVWRAD